MIDNCTCGESGPGTVIVYQGNTEHHCLPPQPCWGMKVDICLSPGDYTPGFFEE